MDKLKLVQCYHCWDIGSHVRTVCPKLKQNEPPLCPKCGESGHRSYECTNEPCCTNCKESHPATARVCSVYKRKFSEVMTDILTELRATPHLHHTSAASPHTAINNITDDAMQTLSSAFLASHSPDGFLLTLYDIMKVKSPKKKHISTNLVYNWDLEMSKSSVSLCSEQSQPHSDQLEQSLQ